MRCYICDKELSDKEGSYNKELRQCEPCGTCLDIALDAAYADGFRTEDDEYVLIVSEETDNEPDNLVRFSDVRMYYSIDGDEE